MPSKAYKTFQKNLNQVNKLIETYNHELERNSGRGKKSLDHLTRAGLIFLCSSFEVYVESVIYETGNFITRKIIFFPISLKNCPWKQRKLFQML